MPKDFHKVNIVKGTGVDGKEAKDKALFGKTYAVKKGDKLAEEKFPKLVATDGYKNPAWDVEKPWTVPVADADVTYTASAVSSAFDKDNVTGMVVKTQPKLEYVEGSADNGKLDLTNLVVTLTDKNGNEQDVPFDKLGEYGITANPAHDSNVTVDGNNGKPVTLTKGKLTATTENLTVTKENTPQASKKPEVNQPYVGDEKITGKGVPGATIVVKDKNGDTIGTTTVKDDKTWEVTVPGAEPLKKDEVITVTQTEKDKTPADETATVKDKDQPTKPTIDNPAAKNEPGKDSTTVTGKTDPNTKVTVTDENGKIIGTGTSNDKGNFTIETNPKQDAGKQVTVTPEGGDGVQVTVTEDKTPDSSGYWFVPINPGTSEKPKHETAVHKLYIYGYEDNSFRPEGNMTRAEAAAMIARLQGLDLSNKARPDFMDVRSGWYNGSINAVVNAGYMKGYPDGTFRPDGKITRAEFAQMIKAIDKANTGMAPFADVKGHWAEAAINQAYANDRIAGYPDGTFRPNDQITRAEAVTIFNKLYDRHVEEPGIADVKSRLVEFNDINRGHWAYFQVVEASNTHEFYRTEKGKVDETWVRILQNWKEALANR